MAEVEQGSHGGQQWCENPSGVIAGMSMRVKVALADMEAPMPARGKRFRWLASDYDSLYGSFELEEYITTEGLPAHAPPLVRQELNEHLNSWHAALPFSEGERGFVLNAYREQIAEPWEEGKTLDKLVRRRELEIMDAGLRKVVKGRDLMKRWWLWKRDMDEFAGQGGFGQARTALTAIDARLTDPDE